MLTLRRGTVTSVDDSVEGLARLEVDGVPCVAYPRLTGPVEVGDEVVVNVQARELGLGSGGFDVLYVNLTRGLELAPEPGAHVMKLPYTPVQEATRHAEEAAPLADSLRGMPVVCCSLHSQLAPVCAGLGREPRVAYLQLAGGALPVALSDAVRVLRERDLLAVSVGVGPCVGGDAQCVTLHAALAWAAASGFDVAVCGIGPGIVGTATPLGHGGMAAADAANAAAALDGRPVVAVRASQSDPRPRHRGVSHHTRAVLRGCLADVAVPWPAGFEAPEWLEPRVDVDVSGWRDDCAALPLSHMGRGPDEDALFFAAAYAAGAYVRSLLR